MKKILILTAFIAFMTIMPTKAHACIKALGFLDPLCVLQGNVSLPGSSNSDTPQTVYNNTNSYNTNSNINSTVTTNTSTNSNPGTVAYIPTPVYPSYTYTQPNYYQNYDSNYGTLGVSCYTSTNSANVGDNVVWNAYTYGGNGNYYITWSGTDNLSGYGTSISKTYNYSGSKYAVVTVVSGNQSISKNCSNIQIYGNSYNYPYDYNYNNNNYNYNYNSPLYVTCTANVSFSPVETNVIWTANASGGNGYYTYVWSGTDYLTGSGKSVGAIYHSPGTKTASVTVYSNNQTITQSCSNNVLIGAPNYYNNNYNNNYVAPAPIVKYVYKEKVVKKETPKVDTAVKTDVNQDNQMSAASLFSLKNVPWGWVAVLVILVLFATVVYLLLNKNKI